jgi:DHA2 family multidrug resistance protein
VGLGLLVLWVGSLQIMLDEGRNRDWFADPMIRWLGIIAVIGFLAFLIWELTEGAHRRPARVPPSRLHRGDDHLFGGFAAFFANIVILPLWLQQNMGYTATWAGMATGIMGLLAILSAPPVGMASKSSTRAPSSLSACWGWGRSPCGACRSTPRRPSGRWRGPRC